MAATNIGTESQSPMLYSKVFPGVARNLSLRRERHRTALRLHAVADTEHGGKGFDLLDKYATTPELQQLAIRYARESARMRWFFFDGIYIHYEMGYKLLG